MRAFLESLEEERQRRFRRFVALSAAVHGLAVLLVVLAPTPSVRTELPGVVRVDLVAASAPPSSAPPSPKPAPPKPAPPKPAPKPKPEKVVIPEKPTPPKPEAKPEPEPEPAPEPAEPAPEPAEPAEEEVGYDDVLAELREQEAQEGEAAGAEAGARSGPPGGPGVRVTAEVMAWMRRAKVHVTRAWVLAPGFRAQSLQAQIEVELAAGGEVQDTRVVRGSGNPWFDESAERAVRKASPLPAPPEAGTWAFVFEPGDAF